MLRVIEYVLRGFNEDHVLRGCTEYVLHGCYKRTYYVGLLDDVLRGFNDEYVLRGCIDEYMLRGCNSTCCREIMTNACYVGVIKERVT